MSSTGSTRSMVSREFFFFFSKSNLFYSFTHKHTNTYIYKKLRRGTNINYAYNIYETYDLTN